MAPKKRSAAASEGGSSSKKAKTTAPKKLKTPPPADDQNDTPYAQLQQALKASSSNQSSIDKQGVVVYWMRNKDFRLDDNHALSEASKFANKHNLPLVVLHIFSPGDYKSHHRSPRRIDFHIRALKELQKKLRDDNVPLYTVTWEPRKQIPAKLADLLSEWKAQGLFANIEHEVDELRRDIEVVENVVSARKSGKGFQGEVKFLNDFVVVPPGQVLTQQGKPYSVYSPWYKRWVSIVADDPEQYLADFGTYKVANAQTKEHALLDKLHEHKIPDSIKGFELDSEDAKNMKHLWPVGLDVPTQVMHRFLRTKIRPNNFFNPPLQPGAEEVDVKKSKIGQYSEGRNRIDWDGTSHLSPYLAAGMISPRACLRATTEVTNGKLHTDAFGSDGVGRFVGEIAWRDFYQHVMCAWPRVSMGRNFNLKYDDVEWEWNEEHLKRWKEGKTGYPIVDAAMRAMNKEGYMHNRCRMIVAMFLTKDLLIHWKEGEKYFSQQLIDCDLGANNGGWQWSASTGTDPQPYFRVFNPTSQSEKSDPEGTYIRHWLPELKNIKGKAIHEPTSVYSKKELEKMGYCAPIVDHAKARVKAIARFKNPGSKDDE